MKNTLSKLALFSVAALVIAPLLSFANGVERERDIDGAFLPPHVKYKTFVHYPQQPAKPQTPAPSCTVTTNDQISDYGMAGWHLAGSKIYRLNESTVPLAIGIANAYSAINAAWSAWYNADSHITVSQGANTSLSRPKYDGTNLLAWGTVPNGAIAVTYTWYNTVSGEQVESDTIFNKRLKWSYMPYSTDCGGAAGTYDAGDIATHEFGHWIGLDDLYNSADKDLTMYGYGFTAELKKDTLGLGDKIGAAAITP